MIEKNVFVYATSSGKEPFTDWLFHLKDMVVRHRIETRIDRLKQGHYGDHKRFKGIVELRLNVSKGYRIYFGEDGNRIIILLMGGHKGSQKKDIQTALKYWSDYYVNKKA